MKIRERLAKRIEEFDAKDVAKLAIGGAIIFTVGGTLYKAGVKDGMKIGVAVMDKGFQTYNPIKWADLVTDTELKILAQKAIH